MQVKDSPLLLQQIEALQLSIKHLKNENNRLKVRRGQQMLLYGGEGALWGAQPGHEGTVPTPVLGWQHLVVVLCPCPAPAPLQQLLWLLADGA